MRFLKNVRGGRIGAASVAILTVLFSAGLVGAFVGGAQAAATGVPLGTADSYAVLAGSGITNTGMTTIAGDVGSSPTSSETGFAACPSANCVALTGANHTSPNPNDTATQQAKAALTTAYNDAAGQSPTMVPTELAGQTLTAGVYDSASGTFGMTGTLVLDGQNNPNSVFIFQTASTLITGGTGNVSLIRGAQSCNVFWKVGSAATLGAGSTFRGTILAHDDISLGNGVTVDGRLLGGEQASGAGAVTLIHDTITKPTCSTPAPSTPAFTADTPPAATVGTPYSYSFTASGSPAPTFTVASGNLPTGLTLDSATGALSGTPSAGGTYTFSITATNAAGSVTSGPLAITVGPGLATGPTTTAPGNTISGNTTPGGTAPGNTAPGAGGTSPGTGASGGGPGAARGGGANGGSSNGTGPGTTSNSSILPFTGVDALWMSVTGLILVLMGVALLHLGRGSPALVRFFRKQWSAMWDRSLG
ncbi:MAG: hypothetical protein DLM54_04115 [Acidimicrobiales bacterium]|nr:MAG: hypothetical protein DLM54_04115 [Acidimicrobiales bacterium]